MRSNEWFAEKPQSRVLCHFPCTRECLQVYNRQLQSIQLSVHCLELAASFPPQSSNLMGLPRVQIQPSECPNLDQLLSAGVASCLWSTLSCTTALGGNFPWRQFQKTRQSIHDTFCCYRASESTANESEVDENLADWLFKSETTLRSCLDHLLKHHEKRGESSPCPCLRSNTHL